MRIANVQGRLKLLIADGALDVETASGGRIGADPQHVYERWDELRSWALTVTQPSEAFQPEMVGPPAPAPRQLFAIGLNYREHAAETGRDAPTAPVVFTKFVSSIAGPVSEVTLPSGSTDWEVELVVVMAKTSRAVRV